MTPVTNDDFTVDYELYNESSKRQLESSRNFDLYYSLLVDAITKILFASVGLNIVKYLGSFIESTIKLILYAILWIYIGVVIFFTWLDIESRDYDNMSRYLFTLNNA